MVIYVDIDHTICIPFVNNEKAKAHIDLLDYNDTEPIKENIEKINKLYEEGHTIIYWTARGSLSGKNWLQFTKEQLKGWGAKYHKVRCDKPFYDKFVDDKAFTTIDEMIRTK